MLDRKRPRGRCRAWFSFTNGTNDFAYPLDSYQKSYRAVRQPIDLRIEVEMKHSHKHGWEPKEIGMYVDSVLIGGKPLARLGPIHLDEDQAHSHFKTQSTLTNGQLHYTSDTGPWQERKWKTVDARIADGAVEAEVPEQRPLVFYLSATDERDAMVSTEHVELTE